MRIIPIDPEVRQVRHLLMERKPADLYGEPFEATVEVYLQGPEWNDFLNNPLRERDWLAGHQYVLVIGPADAGTVAVNTEGYPYARYATRIA